MPKWRHRPIDCRAIMEAHITDKWLYDLDNDRILFSSIQVSSAKEVRRLMNNLKRYEKSSIDFCKVAEIVNSWNKEDCAYNPLEESRVKRIKEHLKRLLLCGVKILNK